MPKYGDLYSELVFCIYPSNVYTREHTPGAVGSHLGGSVWNLNRDIEGGERALYITPPTYNSYLPETRSRNLWVTSLTLTIRTRLPTAQKIMGHFFPCIESKWRLGFLTSKSCEFGPTWGRLLLWLGKWQNFDIIWDGNKVSLGFD